MGSIWISCKIFFHPWIWNKVLNVKIFWVCPFGGFGQIFLKQIAEKLVVFRGKMWVKVAKERFHGKHGHIILFSWYGIQWNSADQNGYIHVLFWSKCLEPRGGIHWKGLNIRQNPWFKWNHHGFQPLTKKHVKPPFCSAKCHWNRTKKMSGFPIKSEQKRVNQSSASKG